MEKGSRILVAGAGHLAFQIYRQLKEKGYDVVRVAAGDKPLVPSDEYSAYEQYQSIFQHAGIAEASTVYIVDDYDQANIQFFLIASKLNPKARLVVSLFNNSLSSHIKKGQLQLQVFNPAEVACLEFVKAAEAIAKKTSPIKKLLLSPEKKTTFVRSIFFALPASLFAIIFMSTAFFHYSEGLSWLDAFYFTCTTVTTTGFGDISLLHADPVAKIFVSILMLVGVSFISVVFSFVAEWLLVRRAELSLGQKQYRLQGHIILCGLGRLGYQVTLELLSRGHKVLVIECNPDNRFMSLVRTSGGQVFVADASLPRNLQRANVAQAKAILSVIQDDFKNLEIGLAARTQHPTINLVLRVFDRDIASEIGKKLHVPVAISASFIVATRILQEA